MPHPWIEMHPKAAFEIHHKYGGNKKIINALIGYAYAGEGIAKLDRKEALDEFLEESGSKFTALREMCEKADFRNDIHELCESLRAKQKSTSTLKVSGKPGALAHSTPLAAAASSSMPRPAAFTPNLSIAEPRASAAQQHAKAIIGGVTNVIADAPDKAWLHCTAPLALEDFRTKINEITAYAERLFPSGSQGDDWCGDVLETNSLDKPPHLVRTTNGTLKHLVVENILKKLNLNLKAGLQGEYEWKNEAPYTYDSAGKVWKYTKGSKAPGSIRPDIVVHRKGEPNKVVCVIDLKFPCPPRDEPILIAKPHPIKKDCSILQTDLYNEALHPTNGVWLVSPMGIKRACISGQPFKRLADNPPQATAVLATQAASSACITLLEKPPFNMTPIASAISKLSARFTSTLSPGRVSETDNIKKYIAYLEDRLSEISEQSLRRVHDHFDSSTSHNAELPPRHPHTPSEVKKPVATTLSRPSTAQSGAHKKRPLSNSISSADSVETREIQQDANKVSKTTKASPGATQSSAPASSRSVKK